MFHHPAFQSLVLPLILALLGMLLTRAVAGERHAAWGGLLGLVGALAWLPGFDWPADSRTQKLPWMVLAGLALAVLDAAWRGRRWHAFLVWLGAGLAWAFAVPWLAGEEISTPALVAAVFAGWGVLFAMGRDLQDQPATRTAAAVALALAALGLAGLGATGGSLLVAQLAAMLATTVVAAACWTSWRRACGTMGSSALWQSFGLVWLAIAWIWVLAAPAASPDVAWAGLDAVRSTRVAVLALAISLPALLSRRHAARWEPWAIVSMGAVAIVLAVAVPEQAAMPAGSLDPDDPYLTPSGR